ncbi:hypothetical protein SAMN05444420_1075 [Capnocytophaga granulosa]|uniref:Uncharacterized protein n=1 Tax=Capnocytophaga granulosa TaxID=45242 RepID=A0A1H2YE38_9FLAO|nr:hypothetical protein [Capnocytophaga granulosa]EPD27488.1 hypothetical protein HMPREF9331_02246 [Capnocytophaga granulosa ATCC 51502]SDX03225.1 hypothetical protein SAMN05444420_1075 [Capnocytophaga granulosa]SUX18243.1 Uncharacterised protein [Capnocytophaga granulosa]
MSVELQNNETPERKKGGGLIIALLSIGLVGAGGYAFYQSNEARKNEEAILEKRDQVIKELESLQKDYDEAVTVSKQNADELADAKARIAQYIDSLKTMKADINVLFKYRDQVEVLKKERQRLLAINDSLRKYNVKVTQQRDSTAKALNVRTTQLDSVSQKASELSKVIDEGSILSLKSLTAQGMKEKSGGRYVDKERSGAVDKIKVCYTVGVNRIAPVGNRTFYVQVLSPNGITLGDNDTVSVGERTVNYSAMKEFLYERNPVDVCEYISSITTKYEPGTYQVFVFDDQLREIGKTELNLR